tara:strand:- start:469 stop:975 length:507 start_codon:yes stop_codon:yes gene_type:complete
MFKEKKIDLRSFSMTNYFIFLFLLSVFTLSSAYILEYFFNHPACKLCIYQRIPYFFLILLSFITFLRGPEKKMIYISIFFLTTSIFISGFHSLVERKLISYNIGCTSTNMNFENIEDLRNFLEDVPIVKCDEILFSIFGLSLANLNLIISVGLIILSIIILKKYGKTY